MAKFELSLLGPMQVLVDGQNVDATFRTKKERALLAYLAVEARKQHQREALAELLWPDRPEGYARTNLRQALLGLRRALGRDVLAGGDEHLRYGLASSTWLDTEEFQRAIQFTQAHSHASLEHCPECAAKLESAVELYRGDYLEDILLSDSQGFQEWVVFHREQFFRHLLSAFRSLIEFFQSQHDFENAYHYAYRYVNAAPMEESAHRGLMNLLALSGRRNAALEQFQTLRQILLRELGVEPAAKTKELYESIRREEVASVQPPVHRGLVSNLPLGLTSFVGREDEVRTLQERLTNPDCRLIVLSGAAGSGKTRLIQQCAINLLNHYADGVWIVPLHDVNSPEQMAKRIVDTIGLPYPDEGDALKKLPGLVRPLRALVVLDRFENLIASTGIIVELLQQASRLKIVLTSRRRINYQAATVLDLAGLPYPAPQPEQPGQITPAETLFTTRAQQALARRARGEKDAQMIAEICRIVEGLPLAIELAASALRVTSLERLSAEIQQGLDVLATSLEDVPKEHRSMRVALQYSWDLLNDDERSAFIHVASLGGEFRGEMARLLAGTDPQSIDALVDHSLLKQTEPNRYEMPLLLRHFALEKLAESAADTPGTPGQSIKIPKPRPPAKVKTSPLNVELFWDRIERSLARANRYRRVAGLILLDFSPAIDRAAQNENEARVLLNDIEQHVTAALRGTDTVTYLGGGRFAVVLDELAGPEDTRIVASKLLANLEKADPGGKVEWMSLGSAIYPQDGVEIGELFKTAQERLAQVQAHRHEAGGGNSTTLSQ